jgi:iron complex outermembrane receptor protein
MLCCIGLSDFQFLPTSMTLFSRHFNARNAHRAFFVARIAFCAFVALAAPPRFVEARGQVLRGVALDDASGKALSGARIVLVEAKRGAISGADGTFAIRLPAADKTLKTVRRNSDESATHSDSYTLRATLVGYAPLERALRLEEALEETSSAASGEITIELRLKHVAVRLGEARVETARTHRGNIPTQNVTTLSEQDLERSRGQTLGETLQNLPGITLLQTGVSIAKPVIRGLHSQRVVVVNAGVAQEGQQWGADHAPEIDPFAASAIEVARGAAGVEYGAGAIGGVVRVLPSALPRGEWFGGEANAALFSNNAQGALSLALEGGEISLGESGSVLRAIGKGFGWRSQTSARKAGDTRAPDYVIGNTGFQELNASLAFGYADDNFSVEAYYSLFTTELGIFRGAHIGNLTDLERAIANGRPFVDYEWTYAIGFPRQQISHDLWSVKALHNTEFGAFEAQYGWQQNNRAEFDAHNARIRGDSGLLIASLERPAMTLQLTTYSLDVKFRRNAAALAPETTLSGVAGLSGMAQWNAQGGRTFLIPSFEAQTLGAYIIETLTAPDFLANLGIRYDARFTAVRGSESRFIPDTTQFFSGISAAAGAMWFFSLEEKQAASQQKTAEKPFSLALNCGAAWRAPLVNEQFSLGVHHGTAQYEIGDSRLQPERSYNADVTARYATETARVEISAYANAIENFIYLRPDAANSTVTIRGTFPTMLYTQTFALLRGIDGSVEATAAECLRLGGTFSLVRGDNIADDEPLIFMPADRLRAFVRYEAPPLTGAWEGIFVEFASTLVRRQDRFPENVDYALPPPGYVLFDASVGGVFEAFGARLSWSVTARNLLNTPFRDYLSRYRYFADDAGRNIIVRVSLPFGDGGGR